MHLINSLHSLEAMFKTTLQYEVGSESVSVYTTSSSWLLLLLMTFLPFFFPVEMLFCTVCPEQSVLYVVKIVKPCKANL